MTPSSHLPISRIRFRLLSVSVALAWVVVSVTAEDHWSLQSVTKEAVPAGVHPVDHFIHEKLGEKGLSQNPSADRFTLLRRATIDLTGLPPTREEIEAFGDDSSEDAWETLVDRLLASPHYGERWGRHWLDVARYVQGTIKVPGIDEIDLAAPYRDYVVRSLNADKPYDRFITEQLAGDLLGTPDETEQAYFDRITAPAFLSIGQWFEECTDPNKLRLDIIDEQISTLTRAFLAMDFACSRCHDHKYDPIPIRDYYAMAGIFRSTKITSEFAEEWKDGRPRMAVALRTEEEWSTLHEESQRMIDLNQELVHHLGLARQRIESESPEKEAITILDSREAEDFDGQKNLKVIEGESGAHLVTRKRLDQWAKYRFVVETPGNYSLLIRYSAPNGPRPVKLEINGDVREERVLTKATYWALEGRLGIKSGGKERWSDSRDLYGTDPGFRWVAVPLKDLRSGSNFIRFLVDRHEEFPILDKLHLVKGDYSTLRLEQIRSLGPLTLSQSDEFLKPEETKVIAPLQEEQRTLRNRPRGDVEITVTAIDAPQPVSLPIHTGGDTYQTEGDPIPRGVPTLADHLIEASFDVPADESGRLKLAEWLTHPNHPLTARVMVNRIWHWHFGKGIVRTTDDFGKQNSPPTHPELLDWLAAEFIESGWSIKHIQRLILTSDTYRASTLETSENKELDPDGKWFSRYPMRRLEVEAIYDGMLSSIGKVPRQPAGQPLDNSQSKDRALYILTSARSPMGLGIEIRKMFPLFGFDESGRPMHDRDESKTADQSLWWLNNPLPRYYAEKLSESLLSEHEDATERANAAYERIMGKPLNGPAESALLRYVEDLQTAEQLSEQEAWTRACLGLFSSHPFSHLE